MSAPESAATRAILSCQRGTDQTERFRHLRGLGQRVGPGGRWLGAFAELGLHGPVDVAVDVVGAEPFEDAVALERRRAPPA